MGNFYVNYTCKGALRDAVVAALSGYEAFVVFANDVTYITERATSEQDEQAIEKLASMLSQQLDRAVLAVLNHDDDVLKTWLAEKGEIMDRYNSNPGYGDGKEALPVGGDAEKIVKAFGGAKSKGLADVMHPKGEDDRYMFASDCHRDICIALGVPDVAVGFAYAYVGKGELPEFVEPDDIVSIGPSHPV